MGTNFLDLSFRLKQLEIEGKIEQSKIEIRKFELQNEKEIAAKHEETLLKIEEAKLKAKEASKENDATKKKEKEEEIKKDFDEIKKLIEENNKKIVEGVGKKTSKLEEQQIKVASDAKNAREMGDKKAEQIALRTLAEVDKKIKGLKQVGNNLLNTKDIDLLAQETAKP
jgi:Fe-S cluster assembly scaffold protein SufB